jgi:hypothetical protein
MNNTTNSGTKKLADLGKIGLGPRYLSASLAARIRLGRSTGMARNVADLCHEHGLTVPQLAERAALEEDRVLAIALGRWTPSPSERQKIAAVFGVAVDDITWGHQTPIQHLYGHGPG